MHFFPYLLQVFHPAHQTGGKRRMLKSFYQIDGNWHSGNDPLQVVSLRLGLSPLQDTCLRPRLSRTTIDVEIGNRTGIRGLLLIFHERIKTV